MTSLLWLALFLALCVAVGYGANWLLRRHCRHSWARIEFVYGTWTECEWCGERR